MKLSVLIPTYRRAESLGHCLQGLESQVRSADEILIIVRAEDLETLGLLEEWKHLPALKILVAPMGGAVAQANFGLDASQGDVVAFTDDDAVPRPDWLLRIERHFEANADVGGVGGRDFVQENGVALTGSATLVGVVQWFGRITMGHHLGARLQPSVDALKGVNMSFRSAAIGKLRFDTDLRGKGAQTCMDMAFSFGVQRQGWRLLYDPEVAVDHFPAPRFDADQRKIPTMDALENNSFNIYLSLRRHLRPGWRRFAALRWAQFVGVERSPGLIRGLISQVRGDKSGIAMRDAARRAWKAAKEFRSAS